MDTPLLKELGRTLHDVKSSAAGRVLLDELLAKFLVMEDDWRMLPLPAKEDVLSASTRDQALSQMVRHGLLTDYQASRISVGTTFGLVLGNYRVLDRLGVGGMAVVFKAEHVVMRHLVAIKVLAHASTANNNLQNRFSTEMRIIARLKHPNIVAALDAGSVVGRDRDEDMLWYLVMEHVCGRDLEGLVREEGPLNFARGCDIAFQAAQALDEIHKCHLVHRDIKPSNIMVTPEQQAKLLDFGLSRHVDHRITQPGTLIGTLDFMAPEQATDASNVDIRADIYSLGVTLYWAITGRLPFPGSGEKGPLPHRRNQALANVRQFVPEAPPEFEMIFKRMMAFDRDERYATPRSVIQVLAPFVNRRHSSCGATQLVSHDAATAFDAATVFEDSAPAPRHKSRLLIVGCDNVLPGDCRAVLQSRDLECEEVGDLLSALRRMREKKFDLVLLRYDPAGKAADVDLLHLREASGSADTKILVVMTGAASPDEVAKPLAHGADDFLLTPLVAPYLYARVKTALCLKEAVERSQMLNERLVVLNQEYERKLSATDLNIAAVRSAFLAAITQVLELREPQLEAHLQRMQRFCELLAKEAAGMHPYADEINRAFLEELMASLPLYDVGKNGLPDDILLKSGKFTTDERLIMQTHTTLGAEMLYRLAEQHPTVSETLRFAALVARHHHEHWDGSGYPDRLAGPKIPLAARIIKVCDVYDALRMRRSFRPAISHESALVIMHELGGQFDPALFDAFHNVAPEFDRIFREHPQPRGR